jgi:predicted nucleic acid-binding Zn ribbon protein
VGRGELKSIQELLPSVLTTLARSTGNADHLKPVWERLVGPIISRHATPIRLQANVLTIETTNTAWARELSEREPEIRDRLAAALGHEQAALRLVFRSRE